jgi:hypothetical protein
MNIEEIVNIWKPIIKKIHDPMSLSNALNMYFVEMKIRQACYIFDKFYKTIPKNSNLQKHKISPGYIFTRNDTNVNSLPINDKMLGKILGYNCAGFIGWDNTKKKRYTLEYLLYIHEDEYVQVYAEVCPKYPTEKILNKFKHMAKMMNDSVKLLDKKYSIITKISEFGPFP